MTWRNIPREQREERQGRVRLRQTHLLPQLKETHQGLAHPQPPSGADCRPHPRVASSSVRFRLPNLYFIQARAKKREGAVWAAGTGRGGVTANWEVEKSEADDE